jgi:hypothetical protein
MLKTTKFLIATALATLIAAPALAQSLTYVGNSEATFNVDRGVLNFHAACDDTFEDSQFCTSEDIIRGGAFPLVAGNDAWVHPIQVAFDTGGGVPVLFSGAVVPTAGGGNSPSCQGWSSNASTVFGLVMNTPRGFFTVTNCNNILPVACCEKKGGPKGK